MFRFISFLATAVLVIYIGVWLFLAFVAYMILVWFMVLLWNKVISEILTLPEIGMFGGTIFTTIVIVISTTIYFFWVLANAPGVTK